MGKIFLHKCTITTIMRYRCALHILFGPLFPNSPSWSIKRGDTSAWLLMLVSDVPLQIVNICNQPTLTTCCWLALRWRSYRIWKTKFKPYLSTSWFDKVNWQDHCHVKVDQNLWRTERNHKSDNFDWNVSLCQGFRWWSLICLSFLFPGKANSAVLFQIRTRLRPQRRAIWVEDKPGLDHQCEH